MATCFVHLADGIRGRLCFTLQATSRCFTLQAMRFHGIYSLPFLALRGALPAGKEVGRSHEQQSGEENLGGAHSSKLAPAGTKSSMKRKLSREGDVAAVKRAATEPPTSSSLPRLPQNSSAGPNGREPDLVRTASVAGDSEHIAEGLAARGEDATSCIRKHHWLFLAREHFAALTTRAGISFGS